ncbi:MAG: 2Fe-2S iron-sulfur cluster binding domain-containing protein [Acidobacteriia bacterium]|nr:2Fe-2S iron-sulfur cluster binding domain-containing protein [Terriglobia bacterium]
MREAIGETEGLTFFLCGPPPFMQVTHSILTELGAKPEQIRSETFGTERPKFDPATQPANRTHEVEFVRSGARAAVTGGQTLLEAASIAGVAIPSACRQGQCGTCKTRLIAGEVHMAAEQGLDPESKARGFVLACVGYPAGNVALDA